METRFVPRITVQLKLLVALDEKPEQNIKLVNGQCFEAEAADISEGGLCLVIKKYYLPRGTSIELTIDGKPFELKKEIKLKGEISYCRNYKSKWYKCGIKIVGISEEHARAIKAFIARYDKRENPRFYLPE